MNYRFSLLLCFALMLASPVVHAGYVNGETLKGWLEETNKEAGTFHSGSGFGYVAGVVDSLDGVIFCIPGDVKLGTLRSTVLTYIYANSGNLKTSAEGFVARALKNRWPCKQSTSSNQAPSPSQKPVKPAQGSASPF